MHPYGGAISKKPPIFEVVSKPQLRNTFTTDPELKARVSALRIGPDWAAVKAVVQCDNARNPARDRAEAEAKRIAETEWKQKPTATITAMTEFVTGELAKDTEFMKGKNKKTPWSEKAVRGWIAKLAPSHKPGRPRDE